MPKIENSTTHLLLARIARQARGAGGARQFLRRILPLIAEGAGVRRAEVWHGPTTGNTLRLIAAHGNGAEKDIRWAAGAGTFAGGALKGETAVPVPENTKEALPRDNGIVIPIPGEKRPYGLLWIGLDRPFRQNEVVPFLQSAAEIMATGLTAIETKKVSQEPFYRNLFDFALSAIFVANDAGGYVDANPAACQMVGYSLDQLRQMSIWDLTPNIDQETGENEWRRFLEDTYQEGEYKILREDGHVITVEYRAVANVAPGRHISIMHDITERKETEVELRRQEDTYRSIFQGVRDAIFVEDMNGRILDANDAACDMYGYDRETFRTKSAHELVPADHYVILPEEDDRLKLTTQPVETVNIRANGELFPIELTGQVTTLQGERVWLVVVRDVSKRKQVEDALRREKKRLTTLLSNLPGMAYRCQAEWPWTMYFVSQGCEALIGYRPSELIDDQVISYGQIIHPDDVNKVKEVVTAAIAQGKPFELRYRILTREGAERWVWERGCQIQYQDKEQEADPVLEGFITDVTEQVQATRALRNSEQRFRTVLENLDLIAVMLDKHGRITFANDFLLRLTGWQEEEVLGQNWFDYFIPESIRSEIQAIFQNNLKEGTLPSYYENELVTRSGEPRLIEWANTILSDAQGEIVGVTSIGKDVTEQRQMETALRRSEHTLRTVLQAAPIGIGLVRARVFDWTNQTFCEMLGYEAEEIRGMNARLLYPDEAEYERVGRILYDTSRSQQRNQLEAKWQRKDGQIIDVRITLTPLGDDIAAGEFVFTAVDVTQQREIERRAKEQQRLAAVGQLAAGIAHDFNNLMAVIVLYTQLSLRDLSNTAELEQQLRTIETQAKRATDLIDQILDFSRQSVMEKQPLALAPFIKEIGKLLVRTLPENIRIHVKTRVKRGIVNADPTRIQQALMNLALNARDAMPGGGELWITLDMVEVTAETRPLTDLEPGAWTRLTIRDTGDGIAPEALPHIYEPFFTTKASDKGSGLGLAQVYGIIKQHEGYIDVETVPSQGTAFFLYLPTLTPSDQTAPATSPSDLIYGNGERILLVEDDQPTLIAIQDSLKLLNYDPIAAPDGEMALEIIIRQRNEIDLIISDAVMPGMSGGELLREVRQRDLDIPFIILSGHPLHTEQKEALEAYGLAEWMAKPPNLHQLAQMLWTHLGDRN